MHVVILAAGQGKRMGLRQSKVLVPVCGKPMIERVINEAKMLKPARIMVVVSPEHGEVRKAVRGKGISFAVQKRPDGTAHAALAGCASVPANAVVLVLFGDLPLVTAAPLRKLVSSARHGKLAVRTMQAGNPSGYSRILRDEQGRAYDLVVDKKLTAAQSRIKEVDAGGSAFLASWGLPSLRKVRPHGKTGELSLTELVRFAYADGLDVAEVEVAPEEGLGVNTQAQRLHAEACLSRRLVADLQKRGVLFTDPDSVVLRGDLRAKKGVLIDRNVQFDGDVTLGADVSIGANCLVKDAMLEIGARLEPFTMVDGVVLRAGSSAGPFARLRPGTVLGRNSKVGNFVETKNTVMEEGAKANHLSYLGDGSIGAGVNIGAGTVLCNYDGKSKHPVTIGANTFVGSGSMLVAPLAIGPNSLIAAGSVVTKDVPANSKVFGRARQISRASASRGKAKSVVGKIRKRPRGR